MPRIELGFTRTECACTDCTAFCKWMPGYLLPEDLPRLAGTTDEQAILNWSLEHLLASNGFLLNLPGSGLCRVPTLVPARQADGCTCHWLTTDGKCSVHENSPYGCAFFDQHQSIHEHKYRATAGALQVAKEWDWHVRKNHSLYYLVWNALLSRERTAPNRIESAELYAKTLNQG